MRRLLRKLICRRRGGVPAGPAVPTSATFTPAGYRQNLSVVVEVNATSDAPNHLIELSDNGSDWVDSGEEFGEVPFVWESCPEVSGDKYFRLIAKEEEALSGASNVTKWTYNERTDTGSFTAPSAGLYSAFFGDITGAGGDGGDGGEGAGGTGGGGGGYAYSQVPATDPNGAGPFAVTIDPDSEGNCVFTCAGGVVTLGDVGSGQDGSEGGGAGVFNGSLSGGNNGYTGEAESAGAGGGGGARAGQDLGDGSGGGGSGGSGAEGGSGDSPGNGGGGGGDGFTGGSGGDAKARVIWIDYDWSA